MAMQLPGTGPHRFWGFSPAYAADGRQMLLLCPGDIRHVLQTLADARTRPREEGAEPRQFWLYEDNPEGLARHMVLLSIALDFGLPRRERAEIFLEVFANTQLRERTAVYIAEKAKELRRFMAKGDGPLAAFLDVDELKMRDRDALEAVFGTWFVGVDFDAARLRDERLRAYYRDRYDVRRNLLDWDYSMNLAKKASIVHRTHFRDWRLTGLAFELRDAAYDTPNRTLASSALGRMQGASVLKRGFWGDIVNSPFAAVGVACDDDRFFKKRSDQHTKTACDVAYYNVVSWFNRLETGKPLVVSSEDFEDFAYGASVGASGLQKGFLRRDQTGPRTKEQLAAPIFEEVDEDEDQTNATLAGNTAGADEVKEDARLRELARRRLELVPPFRLVLCMGRPLDLLGRSTLRQRFHHVHVASHAAHLLTPALAAVCADGATVAVEGTHYLLEVAAEGEARFAAKVVELAERAGLAPSASPVNCLMHFSHSAADAERCRLDAAAKYVVAAPAAAPGVDDGADDMAPPHADADADADAVLGQITDLAVSAAEKQGQPATEKHEAPSAGAVAVGPLARICVITGLPAKYKDPLTGCYYANLDAFRELRRRQAPEADAGTEAAAPATDAATASLPRPPVLGLDFASRGGGGRFNKMLARSTASND